ncbi:CCA tRNA nucleotidyltransferase [Bacillus sp. FJAT-45037]|uniref:CCA tRNA nucleotidyltransferase n=1 Tax=Bacillus sp. FJAT-45037 TaxID=2011007 RepID=UPI0012FD835A|nr:CCA tRNA nucleotidyltransferase [Bacillus sp. FJAT-45037]
MNQSVIQAAKPVLRELENHNHRAHIVGGAVRDLLLNRPIADIDIVTSATAEQIQGIFPKTFRMNNQHQTVIVRHRGELFEVTTERNGSLENDLQARDFTINSMALKSNGDIIDPLDAQSDIERKCIQSNQPEHRMTEDPLRMLRAIRFISDLGFTCESVLLQVIKGQAPKLQTIAIERILKEFYKLVCGEFREQALKVLLETELYKHCQMDCLNEKSIKNIQTLPVLDERNERLVWTFLTQALGLSANSELKAMTRSNQLTKDVRHRLLGLSFRDEHEWDVQSLYAASLDVAKDVEKMRFMKGLRYIKDETLLSMWRSLPIHSKQELNVSGVDLMTHFKKNPGSWLKSDLEWVEQEVICGNLLNEKSTILRALTERGNKQ